MTDLELILTMLGEAFTTEIAKNRDAQGFAENYKAAKAGGNVAGNARKELEQKSGKKIVSKDNFINLVDKILEAKKSGIPAQHWEDEIDVMVYKLYELNYAEAKIIDNDLKEDYFESYVIASHNAIGQ